jgi:4-carboxymuconolactone decarboxylase
MELLQQLPAAGPSQGGCPLWGRTPQASREDRMPPLAREALDEAQRAAADELIAGPRKGVKGPFIPLLRSPRLLAPLQKAGEYLRFDSALSKRVSEFATLVVARQWTQQFEWFVHVPLARQEGTSAETIETLRSGRRPSSMSVEEAFVYDFVVELTAHRGVCDATFRECVERFGERGLIDLVGLIGYFSLVSMVLNVAHTPPVEVEGVAPLPALPL